MKLSEKSPVIEYLRREQANAVRLYLQYKGYHWNVSGPLFHDLHLLFDEHGKMVFDTIDPLAERQRMLGVGAEYTLEAMVHESTIREVHEKPKSPQEMVERLAEAHHTVIQGMKLGFRSAEQHNDPGSSDLFARCVQEHEKMLWFLEEILRGDASLAERMALGPSSLKPKAESIPTGR
jgi:starvation-inducible DNA-binding protein